MGIVSTRQEKTQLKLLVAFASRIMDEASLPGLDVQQAFRKILTVLDFRRQMRRLRRSPVDNPHNISVNRVVRC
jgi:hypothetical protein